MAKKQFKTESKRILDLMVNSIYTHKEIFLRELISNASDALDKLSYRALTDDTVGLNREDFCIRVTADKENRTLTISDNGIGMTAQELEGNLGVIAKSGSLQFKADMAKDEGEKGDVDIIGQFGVGFYSAFMVASEVKVISRAFGTEEANLWHSKGADGYTVTPCDKAQPGTDIILTLKEDTEDEKYSEYLQEYRLRELIKRYSDYVRFPIRMEVTKSRPVETEENGETKTTYESYTEEETVNSMIPLWQRSKSEVTDEDCVKFYKEKFHDMADPAAVIRVNAEGLVSYKAMLFVPSVAPYGYYTTAFQPGLQLYTSGVMIMDKCPELLPEHFRFVQGVVDSQDLSLNISRELLQHDRQLKVIAGNLEKKVKAELKKLMDTDRSKYQEFFKAFGTQLKYGCVADFGMKKDLLSDLLLVYSQRTGGMISLQEYVDNMPEEQKFIYFACAENISIADGLPQTEPIKDKGFDILYLTENTDEFVMQILGQYGDKPFKSVYDPDLGLDEGEEKKEAEEETQANKDLMDFIVETMEGKLSAAKNSPNLKSRAVALGTQGPVSLEMERYFNSIPSREGEAVKAQRVLELNAGHPVFKALVEAFYKDKEKAANYVRLLHDQALLVAGLQVEDPSRFSELICQLMQ